MQSIQKIFGPLGRSFEVLSFFGAADELWVPERTGDYVEDCQLGRFYAQELLGYIRVRDCPPMLSHVCKAISDRGEWTGVEIGFFHEISEAAAGRVSATVA
jgi:hypothetical protein